MNVSIKRAKYFITCNGKYFFSFQAFNKSFIEHNLLLEMKENTEKKYVQLSLFNE